MCEITPKSQASNNRAGGTCWKRFGDCPIRSSRTVASANENVNLDPVREREGCNRNLYRAPSCGKLMCCPETEMGQGREFEALFAILLVICTPGGPDYENKCSLQNSPVSYGLRGCPSASLCLRMQLGRDRCLALKN